jgi:hypothetical protein
MTNITEFARTAIAATGALVASIVFVSAAVAPAHTAGHAPAATYAQVQSTVQSTVQANA